MPSAPDAAANKQKPFDDENAFTDTAVVVIGRNEGERLRRCLASLLKQPPVPLVYVDSGSTDNSVSLATKLGVDVIELDPSTPFSMARARNTGFSHVFSSNPTLKFVQFVDGDCELEAGWLFQAQRFLSRKGIAVAVCGHLRERSPQTSIYNRLANMEWQGPVGEISACGGIAMYRVSAFEALNGFNENMIAGEEPDLCARLRQAGGQVWRLDHPMAVHDAAMTEFRQWWIRAKRGGYASAHALITNNRMADIKYVLKISSILVYGFLLPMIWLFIFISSTLSNNKELITIISIIFLIIILKPLIGAYKYIYKYKNSKLDSFIFAIFCLLGKMPESIGMMGFFFDLILSKKSKLIEYKKTTQ